jgi:hypothetical protein
MSPTICPSGKVMKLAPINLMEYDDLDQNLVGEDRIPTGAWPLNILRV